MTCISFINQEVQKGLFHVHMPSLNLCFSVESQCLARHLNMGHLPWYSHLAL